MARKKIMKPRQDCCTEKTHPDHAGELPALNRIGGQVEGVKRMIAQRRYCPEIIAQLRAARAALARIEADLLAAHLDACVAEAFNSGGTREKQKKIGELKELYRRFPD